MTDQTHQHRHFIPAMGADRLLPLYDVLTRLAGVAKMHDHLADLATIAPGQDVLEIGSGTGNLVLLLKKRHPAATITGLDPDRRALALAERKAARRHLDVRFQHGFAGDLPFPDQSMDRVLSALMFHHLDAAEKTRALDEARRVLRPGGQLHLLDFTGDSHHGAARGRFLDNAGDRIPARLREAGFRDVDRTGAVGARLGLGRCVTFRGTRED